MGKALLNHEGHKEHKGGPQRVWVEVGALGCGFKPQSHRDSEFTWVVRWFWC